LDRIDADVEQLELVNHLLAAGSTRFGPRFVRELNRALVDGGGAEVQPIPILQIGASEDVGQMAAALVHSPRFRRRCSGLVQRAFAGLAEGEAANEADLLSYVLFDGTFTGELIALGRQDARRRHDEIVAFFRAELEHRAPLHLTSVEATDR
jgi:NTE family protein